MHGSAAALIVGKVRRLHVLQAFDEAGFPLLVLGGLIGGFAARSADAVFSIAGRQHFLA